MKKEICKVCKKELTDKSINKSHGVGVDSKGNSYHLDPCWYEYNKANSKTDNRMF